MTPAQITLRRAEARLIERLAQLEPLLVEGDEVAWSRYCESARTLAAIAPQTEPGASGRLMTTAEMASRLHVSTKTVLRRAKKGELRPVRLARRGPGALRWPAEAGW